MQSKQVSDRFNSLFLYQSDGSRRMIKDAYDGLTRPDGSQSYYISAYIGNGVDITPELERKAILSYELIDRFAQSWHTRFPNLYVSMTENVAIYHWPGIPWGLNAAPDLDVNNEEWVYVANEKNNPTRRQVWTGLYYDQTANQWVVSGETPIYFNNQHLITVGNDILLKDLIDGTYNDHLKGTYNFIIRDDGRLIAHPERRQKLEDYGGLYNVVSEKDTELSNMLTLINESNRKTGVISDDENRQILAYTRLEGPDWYFVSVLPKSYLQSTALNVARFMILLGIFLLFLEGCLLFFILRGQIMTPINSFIRASRELAKSRSDTGNKPEILLPVERNDEVGTLARSFDDMAHQLEDYNTQLEKKISERTIELEQNQKELTLQKDIIEKTLEILEQGIIIVDNSFEILSFNRKFPAIFGIPEEIMAAMNNFDEVTEYYVREVEKNPELLEETLERARNREPYSNEFQLPNGKTIKGTQTPVEGGGFVRVYSDITEQVNHLETIEKDRAQLNAALSAAKLGTWTLDILTGTNKVNEQNAALFAYTVEEINGNTEIWKRIIHPDDYDLVNEALIECIKGSTGTYHVEFRAYTSSGELKWIESIGNVSERDEEGKALRITGTQADISTKKKDELALRDSQQLIQAIVENSSFVIYVKDKQGRYMLVNRTWEKQFSISREQAIGKTGIELSSVEIAGKSHFHDLKIIDSGEAVEIEEANTLLDGQSCVYLSTKFPLYNDTGEISGVCCLSSDITERKIVENSLRENQQRLDLALEVGNLGAFEFDAATQTTSGSEIYAKALGYEVEELNQQMRSLDFFERLIHEEDYPFVMQNLAAVLEGRSDRLECQFRINTKNGDLRWFDCNAIPVGKNAAGLPRKLIGTQVDITERKLSEENMKANQQLLDAVIQNNSNIIYVKDADGKYLLLNREYEKIMGVRRIDVIGKTDHELYDQEFADIVRANDLKIINSRERARIEENVGSSTFLSLKFPLFNSDGKVNGICGMSTDITEQKKMQEKLKANQQLLEAVIENSGSVIFVKNKDGKYILVNREFEKAVNIKREDVIGKNDREIYPAEIANAMIENDKKVMASMKLTRSEESPDGITTFLSLKYPLLDVDGRVDGIGGISTDITDQKNLQNSLAFSLELEHLAASFTSIFTSAAELDTAINISLGNFGELIEADRVSLWHFNADGSLINMTHEWCKQGIASHLGEGAAKNLPREQIEDIGLIKYFESGEPFYIRDTNDFLEDKNDIAKFFANLGIKSFAAIPIIMNEKLITYFTVNEPQRINTVSNPNLSILKVIGEALHNETQKHKAAEELLQIKESAQQQEKQLQELIDVSPVAMEIAEYESKNGGIDFSSLISIYFNKKFTETYGWTRKDVNTSDELMNKLYPDNSYQEELKNKWEKLFNRARESDQNHIGTIKVNICCKNGEFKMAESSQSIIGNRQVFTLVDLSHRENKFRRSKAVKKKSSKPQK